MDYKTSLLIYKTQNQNVNSIWKAKLRLVKSATQLFRKLSDSDLLNIENYRNDYENYTNNINSQITTLRNQINIETDSSIIDSLNEQVTQLKIAYIDAHKGIYNSYSNDKISELDSITRQLILLYCTWTEAVFLKLKHTPHGLTLANRENSYGTNISDKWNNLIDHILSLIPIGTNVDDVSVMTTELKTIATDYIIEPSKLRNKIAHGQWREALNRNNDDLVFDTSVAISKLDFVEIDVSFDIQIRFVYILESILESNYKNLMISERHDSYLFLKDKLDRFILSHSDWSVSSRVGFLRQRNSEGQNLEIARKLKNKNIDPEIIKVVTGITV
jgi:hypothetical protein